MMSSPRSLPCAFALIGAGSVGTGVAALLADRGQRIVGVASRSSESAQRAADLLSTRVFPIEQPIAADVYLIGTGPDAFETCVSRLTAGIDLSGRVLVHFSGAHGIEPLREAAAEGAHLCALHPVQACPTIDATIQNLPGSTWGMTTSGGMEDWGADLIRLLDGTPVRVSSEDRSVWHSAAVITSNGLAALMAVGEEILRSIGIDDPPGVLGPLAAGTVTNARVGGGGARTLTGPVVRGEVDVVRTHMTALRASSPDLAAAYRDVSELIARVAVDSGRLAAADADRFRESLGPPA